jgi:hypothetical protein
LGSTINQPLSQPRYFARMKPVVMRNPVHQPVGAEVNGIGTHCQQGEIHRQHEIKNRFALPHVRLEHFENVEALPEQK